jgi:predicted NUDIX family phosphoesterase
VETDEKDQVEEAVKTKQNAEYTDHHLLCPHSQDQDHKEVAKVSIDRDRTEEFDVEQQYAGNTALTTLKYIKTNHTEFKKISVQVDTKRAETEEHIYVKSRKRCPHRP